MQKKKKPNWDSIYIVYMYMKKYSMSDVLSKF